MKYLTTAASFGCKACPATFSPQVKGTARLTAGGDPVVSESDVIGQAAHFCQRSGDAPRCAVITSILQNDPGPLLLDGQRPLTESCSLLTNAGGRLLPNQPAHPLGKGAFTQSAVSAARQTDVKTFHSELIALSWIDERADLPGPDLILPKDGDGPPKEIDLEFIQKGQGFRFAHHLAVYTRIEDGKILSAKVEPQTQRLVNPATLHVFPADYYIQPVDLAADGSEARFMSVVGSRTTAPEGSVGCAIGAVAGFSYGSFREAVRGCLVTFPLTSNIKVVFPPIWTRLGITINSQGTISFLLLEHSLFPSVSLYSRTPESFDDKAMPFQRFQVVDCHQNVGAWQSHGWGSGNPFGIERGL